MISKKEFRIVYFPGDESPDCDDAYILLTRQDGGEWKERKRYYFSRAKGDSADDTPEYLHYMIITDIWDWIDQGFTLVR